ncbi:cysteine hydrolase [Ancylomarina euxinus]|uniref:Cysteine hydrolase n=1 Tax=Ancylomarina euxinus TaxID=2283627 RepID=A0A425Y509_9BACT|nr:isochorismatase family cysteine hydrolase [Ancylomarina euxinus]MCZ4694401.1 cysteine hydrolase [Ancylomarina euxinus]MUP14269.1 isochorismatase family protein [Ancylomarina euxinus]RRG23588.1 cysteine hydrolase [Ancylomarina euxinus]
MIKKELLFWNVDTQFDFMSESGKLYVPGSEEILPALKCLTSLAKENHIQVVNTADHHFPDAKELSDTPDFVNTFPPHCMADSPGANYMDETRPEAPEVIQWDKVYSNDELKKLISFRNLVVLKDVFDVFEGNPNTQKLVKFLSPQKVFVYGVTTNVCVDCAVCGLAEQNIHVFVIEDAIKELPNIPLPFKKWDALGVKRIKYADIASYM